MNETRETLLESRNFYENRVEFFDKLTAELASDDANAQRMQSATAASILFFFGVRPGKVILSSECFCVQESPLQNSGINMGLLDLRGKNVKLTAEYAVEGETQGKRK